LLSLEECIEYFGDSGQLGHRPSEDTYWISDEYDTSRQCKLKGANNNFWWWLRSPGIGSSYAACVDVGGTVYVNGDFVSYDFGGVRPALRILI
jgi:hypothetical protein